MFYSKIILSLFMSSIFLISCKDKKKIEPEPKEYFSFDANGVHYDYPQIKGTSLAVGSWKTLGAGRVSGSLGYIIRGRSEKNPTSPGAIVFNFAESHIPTEDTIILDGVLNIVTIEAFEHYGDNYQLRSSLPGKIIFTERSNQMLSGTFEFSAELYRTPTFNVTVWTDTFLNITNGKFSIIPTP